MTTSTPPRDLASKRPANATPEPPRIVANDHVHAAMSTAMLTAAVLVLAGGTLAMGGYGAVAWPILVAAMLALLVGCYFISRHEGMAADQKRDVSAGQRRF